MDVFMYKSIFLTKNFYLFFILFIPLLTSCAGVKYWPTTTGKVIEEESGKPLSNAIVIASWHGRLNVGFVDSQSTTYLEEVTTTDSKGDFKIEARFDGLMRSQTYHKHMNIYICKAGYIYTKNKKTTYYLKRFTPNKKNRFQNILFRHGYNTICRADIPKDLRLKYYKEAFEVAYKIYMANKNLNKAEKKSFENILLKFVDEKFGNPPPAETIEKRRSREYIELVCAYQEEKYRYLYYEYDYYLWILRKSKYIDSECYI